MTYFKTSLIPYTLFSRGVPSTPYLSNTKNNPFFTKLYLDINIKIKN